MNFRRSVIIAELWRPEVARLRKKLEFFAFFFGKTIGKRPFMGKFSKIWRHVPSGERTLAPPGEYD